MDSVRKKIRLALGARGALLRTANGCATDAGRHIQHSPLDVTTDDPEPRLAIVAGPVAEAAETLEGISIKRWPFAITGRVAIDPADPLADLVVEDLLDDIKRTFFKPDDRGLGGLAIDVETAGEPRLDAREPGGSWVGVAVALVVVYEEAYGGGPA